MGSDLRLRITSWDASFFCPLLPGFIGSENELGSPWKWNAVIVDRKPPALQKLKARVGRGNVISIGTHLYISPPEITYCSDLLLWSICEGVVSRTRHVPVIPVIHVSGTMGELTAKCISVCPNCSFWEQVNKHRMHIYVWVFYECMNLFSLL